MDAPGCDVHRSVYVSISRILTMLTHKRGLAFTVGLLAVTTLGARPGSVAWIDQFDGHPGDGGLVDDKALQLVEGPGVMPPTLRPTHLNSISNTGEVFEPKAHAPAFVRSTRRLLTVWLCQL